MRLLIAGGSGFIGKNILLKTPHDWECVGTYNNSKEFPNFLKSNGLSRVNSVNVDMKDPLSVQNTFKRIGKEFDLCIYVLGNSDIGLASREPLIDVESNIHPLLNLLQAIRVGKFVFMSSGAVYEGHRGLVDPSLAVTPTNPYAVDKLSSELFIRFYRDSKKHIDSFVNIRFFGAYGPMEPTRKIFTNLIKSFEINQEDTYKIMGNGKNFIDAMYIDDAVEALLKITTSDKGNLTIDLCFGQPLTINELVLEVGRILGREVEIKHEGATAEYTTFFASPKAAETLFNFRPKNHLREGILRFAAYLRDFYS